jgi:hypothetical protein
MTPYNPSLKVKPANPSANKADRPTAKVHIKFVVSWIGVIV